MRCSKNYRKPLLQRYVIRILFLVPIYSASSWASIMSQTAAFYLDPLRDIYEVSTKSKITLNPGCMANGTPGIHDIYLLPAPHQLPRRRALPHNNDARPPTRKPPLAPKSLLPQSRHLRPAHLPHHQARDPTIRLAKAHSSIATIIMKATDTYQEEYLSLTSGYLWSGIFYNISVTLSLYSLAMFWICMATDLKPFRPMPKFLCIKLIIFATYWQGIFLSILQAAGAIPNDVPGYTPDNLAAAIQDSLICFEMPIFAVAHWYAFSWQDYADVTISAARMPVKFALRDAFGPRDLIEDTKETFRGEHYEYRFFDTGDNVLAHEESESRTARMMQGMRYERGGKGKYWIPRPKDITSRTPLLGDSAGPSASSTFYSKTGRPEDDDRNPAVAETFLDAEDERLFSSARVLEYGDWNVSALCISLHPPSLLPAHKTNMHSTP